MAYLLDTDWALQTLAGKDPALSALRWLAPRGIAVSWITIAELYEGAFHGPNPDAHLRSSRQFLSPFRILNLNDAIVERFAELRAFLRRRGERIPDFDLLIGASALAHDLTVLTSNVRHFERIPDLKLYRP